MHRQARVDTPAAVDSVAFSPDGHALAIGRHDGVVTIGPWERSQRPVRVGPVGLGWPAISLGWTADGRKIAVGSLGGTVHVADTRTGRRTGRTISAHSGYVLSVDVSADSSMLLTAGSDGSASLWDLETHTRIGGPMVVGPRGWSFASFLRNDSAVGTVSAVPTQQVWPTTPAAWMRRACSVANRDLTHIERAEFGVPPNLSVCA
jgi:WD40 repeat protein